MAHASVRALWCAALALTAAAAAAQPAPPTGAARTQTLRLAPGPNLVSLSVLPAETGLAALFEQAVDDLVMVRDARGRHFAPGFSTTLTSWSWSEAYLVHVRDSVSVAVTGAAISPEAPIPLRAGWNQIPVLLDAPAPVEAALASVLPNLTRVEDRAGRTFPAVEGRPALLALVPGQGYRVHLGAADTLVYASSPPPAPPPTNPPAPPTSGATHTASTLAEALALPGLAAGQTVEVLGYHAPGDGGGGLFDVSAGNERPDGGLVFVPESALSEWRTHTRTGHGNNNPDYDYGPELPAGTFVPHREWTMTYAPSGAGPFEINAWSHLAGHSYSSPQALRPRFEGTGIGRIPWQLAQRYGDGTWTLRYRATTGPTRLVRRVGAAPGPPAPGSGATLNVRWFGARAEAEAASPADVRVGSDFDVQTAVTWAVNLAQRLNDARFGGTPGTVAEVFVPAGTWRFAGPVELTDGLTLAGAGGTETVWAETTVTRTSAAPEADLSRQLEAAGYPAGVEVPWAGYRTAPGGAPVAETPGSIARWSHQGGVLNVQYRPVRVKPSGVTRLRMFDGVVVRAVRMSAEASHPDALPPDVAFLVGKYQTSVTATSSPRAGGATPTVHTGDGPDVMTITVRDLVLDGNHEANRELWTEGRFGYTGNNAPAEFENWMRNSPSWGGICVTNHGGKRIPLGQTVRLRGVAVLGFGSNGLLGHTNNLWDAEDVLVGNSLWNHTLYGANGRYRNLTVVGFAWTHLTPTAGDVENLVYERPEAAPYRWGGLLGQRGFEVFATDDFFGQAGFGRTAAGLGGGWRVNGYVVDGRGPSPAGSLGAGRGPGTRFEGVIFLKDFGHQGVYGEGHNGYSMGMWSETRFDRVLSTRAVGGENQGLVAQGPYQGLVSTDHVEVQLDADSRETGHYGAPVHLLAGWSPATRGPGAVDPQTGLSLAGTRPWDQPLVQVVRDLYSGTATLGAFGFSPRNGARSTYNGPGAQGFEADPHAPSFDRRSGGSRLFLLDADIRNVTNNVVPSPGGDVSGAERHIAFFVRGSRFRLHDYRIDQLGLALRTAYFEGVEFVGGDADREPRRVYRSEDTQSRTAAGGETALEIPTDLFHTPVAPWSVGDRTFPGGRVSFSGTAAAKVSGYTWARRPNTAFGDDWRAPVLRVTFSQPLAAGETLTANLAVRPWPAGVGAPAD